MCYHVHVIMHVKDPKQSVVSVGHRVSLADFCLSLYSLHVLKMDVNIFSNKYIFFPFQMQMNVQQLLVNTTAQIQ